MYWFVHWPANSIWNCEQPFRRKYTGNKSRGKSLFFNSFVHSWIANIIRFFLHVLYDYNGVRMWNVKIPSFERRVSIIVISDEEKVQCCLTELIMPKWEKVSWNELWKLECLVNRTSFSSNPSSPLLSIAHLECYLQFECLTCDKFNFNQTSCSTRDFLARNDPFKLDFVTGIDDLRQQNILSLWLLLHENVKLTKWLTDLSVVSELK